MNKDQFYVGQRVKQKDPDEGYMVYGHVTEIKESSIMIKWLDINDPIEHDEDEFPTILDGSPPSFK